MGTERNGKKRVDSRSKGKIERNDLSGDLQKPAKAENEIQKVRRKKAEEVTGHTVLRKQKI